MALSFSATNIALTDAGVSAGNAHTGSFTAASGSRRGVWVFFAYMAAAGTPTFSSATYGGVAMTFMGNVRGSGDPTPGVAVWYVLDSTIGTGSKLVSITISNVNTSAHSITCLESVDVNQTTPTGATGTDSGAKTTLSVGLTTASANNVMIGNFAWRRDSTPLTVQSGETILSQGASGVGAFDVTYGAASEPATGGADTIGLVASASQRCAAYALEVIEDTGGAVTGNPWYAYRNMRAA